MDDQERVQGFLQEFSSKLAERFDEDLDFILLFGSAARGEWRRGVSDVDLIIQVKNSGETKKITKEAEKIFWEIDEKYDTKFREVCSIGDDKNNIKRILREARLYVPFEVFGPEDMDWVKGEIKKKELVLGARLVAPQSMLFKKMKYEGKILYGRDIRKVIQAKANQWEKTKALLIPYYVAFSSGLLALFAPKTALKMADKAVIYSIESFLFFLDKPIGGGLKKATQEIEREMRKKVRCRNKILESMELDFLLGFNYQQKFDSNFVNKAIEIKYNWPEEYKKFSRTGVLGFCCKSIFFVNSVNWQAILRADKHRIILKILIVLRTVLLFFIIWLFFYYLNEFL